MAAVRAQFPALANYVWFQNGGVSITPEPIAREHMRLMEELLARGPMHIIYPEEEYPRRRRSMERLARYFDADADELAVMRGVSEAFHTVLRGLPWEAGDRIVISDNEEAALLLPSLHLRERLGVEVVKLPLTEDREELMAAADAALTPRTRLLALSHVTTDMGFRFPSAPLCGLARERGIPSFLDLAHSCGAVPYRLRDLGCDFAGLLSYKWMFSPYAAGALWVRREKLHDIEVTYAGCRAEKWLDFESDTFELPDTAQRFQYGPWSWPLVHAWAAAADWLQEIGPGGGLVPPARADRPAQGGTGPDRRRRAVHAAEGGGLGGPGQLRPARLDGGGPDGGPAGALEHRHQAAPPHRGGPARQRLLLPPRGRDRPASGGAGGAGGGALIGLRDHADRG